MIYRAMMSVTYYFDIKADSEEEALDWLSIHDIEDVEKESTYIDVNYYDDILEESTETDYVAVDISTED